MVSTNLRLTVQAHGGCQEACLHKRQQQRQQQFAVCLLTTTYGLGVGSNGNESKVQCMTMHSQSAQATTRQTSLWQQQENNAMQNHVHCQDVLPLGCASCLYWRYVAVTNPSESTASPGAVDSLLFLPVLWLLLLLLLPSVVLPGLQKCLPKTPPAHLRAEKLPLQFLTAAEGQGAIASSPGAADAAAAVAAAAVGALRLLVVTDAILCCRSWMC